MNYVLAPSILAADFSCLGRQLQTIAEAGADYVHIDVMDGAFVPQISFGIPVMRSIRSHTDKVFDVHLMIEEPDRYIEDFVDAGADIITVHVESCRHLDRTIGYIHKCGCRAGVAINPATPISALEHVLDQVDMVLIMTVNPGFGGQSYLPYCGEKVRALRALCQEREQALDIEVDGGISAQNAADIVRAGANILVAGSAVFRGDIAGNVRGILEKMKEEAGRWSQS